MWDNQTYQGLLDWAHVHFNYEEDEVKSIMRSMKIERFYSHTDPKTGTVVNNWWTCTSVLRDHYLYSNNFPEHCPVCKGDVDRDTHYDNLFGVYYGWRCLTDPLHFMQSRIQVLKEKVEQNAREPEPSYQS